MIFRKNLPAWERAVRVAGGGLMIAYALLLAHSHTGAMIVGASGAVVILTGFFGFCPACAMIGRKPV